jgi:uncharacterized protein (TIGR02231 family)
MRNLVFTLVLVASLGVAAPSPAAEPELLATRITAVTVFADRAQVTRAGSVDLATEPARYLVNRLPGWIDAESVRVALDPPGAGQILDVGVQTAFLAESSEEAVRKATAAVTDIADEIANLQDEERTLQDELHRLDALRGMSMDKVPREIAVGDIKVKNLSDTMAYITETARTDRKQMRVLSRKRRDLEPVLMQRQRELAEVQVRAQLQQSTIVVEVRGVGKAQLRVSYLTPGAAWEPVGELRVSRGGASVSVQQYASVVQTTGEDWSGAALAFSTQRPDDVLDVPRAHGLMLDRAGLGLGDVIGRMGGSFTKAQTLYSQQNAAVAKNQHQWNESLARQNDVQVRAVESFARLTSRGTTAHFAALAERTVRSDGKSVRVPIAVGEFTAKTKVVAVPEVSLNAVRVADLVNGGSVPILPQRVALFTDGAFVGSSELSFAAQGEAFSVFLGVHDRIKLSRTLDKKTSTLHRSGKRTEMALAFLVTAENLGNEPVTVELSERIPVAQTEEIEVDDVETPHKVKPDGQGLVRWSETLAPHQKLTLRISYTLEYPSDFVARRRAADEREPQAPASPAAPRRKTYEQIDMLEKSL